MIISTKSGKIRGIVDRSLANGKVFYSFLGVAYAKPPIGDLRFMPPIPVEPWDDIYDATYERDVCCQTKSLNVIGSEDCLHLNIYLPKLPKDSELKPVMVYIYEGGFHRGSPHQDLHGADYLMDHDIILVTVNYRIHILGFMNLGIAECAGNMGLKDQVMALKWIKENIREFGGDANNVTVFGCSSGSSCVNLLMISPLSKGLFAKTIMQSGTALSSWSLTHDPLKWAFKAARMLDFEGHSVHGMLKFMKSVPCEQLMKIVSRIMREYKRNYPAKCAYYMFAPSVEECVEGAFLPDYPEKLLKIARPVPCIVGVVKLEGSHMWKLMPEAALEHPLKALPYVVKNNFQVDRYRLMEIERELKRVYFDNSNHVQSLFELMSDLYIWNFYESFEFVTRSKMPAYVYHYTFDSDADYNFYFTTEAKPFIKGPYHAAELSLIFFQRCFGTQQRARYADHVKNNVLRLWTNFAKFGNPTDGGIEMRWRPSTLQTPCYLRIDENLKLIDGKIDEKRITFLKELFKGVKRLL